MIEYDRHLQDLTEAIRRGIDAGLDPLATTDDCPYAHDAEACRRLWMDAYTKGRIALGMLTLAQGGTPDADLVMEPRQALREQHWLPGSRSRTDPGS